MSRFAHKTRNPNYYTTKAGCPHLNTVPSKTCASVFSIYLFSILFTIYTCSRNKITSQMNTGPFVAAVEGFCAFKF